MAKLADQADTVLALCGLLVLVGPALGPALDLVRELRSPGKVLRFVPTSPSPDAAPSSSAPPADNPGAV
jgi:hypothetical protein